MDEKVTSLILENVDPYSELQFQESPITGICMIYQPKRNKRFVAAETGPICDRVDIYFAGRKINSLNELIGCIVSSSSINGLYENMIFRVLRGRRKNMVSIDLNDPFCDCGYYVEMGSIRKKIKNPIYYTNGYGERDL